MSINKNILEQSQSKKLFNLYEDKIFRSILRLFFAYIPYLSIIENLGLTEEAYIVSGPELEKFYETELTRHNLLSQICANFRENNLLLAQSWDSKKEPKP